MAAQNIQWDRFTVKAVLNTEKNRVIDAWTSRSGLESWFLRSAKFFREDALIKEKEEIRPGDNYEWMWFGWPDDVIEKGEVLEPRQDEFIRFTFGKAGIVAVGFEEKSGEQLVVLTQENIPTDDEAKINFYVGCQTGWTFYLQNLKAVLIGGIDLRNKNNSLGID